jgi:hypothetical protein
MEILPLQALRSSCHNHPCRTQLSPELECCLFSASLTELNWTANPHLNSLTTPERDCRFSPLYSPKAYPRENTVSNHNYCCRGMFTNPLPRSGSNITPLFSCCLHVLFCGNMTFTEPLPSNGLCLQNRCLAVSLYTTTVLWSFPSHTQSCRVWFLYCLC